MSALHDPIADLTPLQHMQRAKRRQRQARLEGLGEKPAREIIEAPSAAPEPIETWEERQLRLYQTPPAKRIWFSIESSEAVEAEPKRYPAITTIMKLTARHFSVRLDDLRCARRTACVVKPRQVAMYLCKTLTLKSLPEIGRKFGNRDHTTVLHAVRKVGWLVETDAVIQFAVEQITQQLGEME